MPSEVEGAAKAASPPEELGDVPPAMADRGGTASVTDVPARAAPNATLPAEAARRGDGRALLRSVALWGALALLVAGAGGVDLLAARLGLSGGNEARSLTLEPLTDGTITPDLQVRLDLESGVLEVHISVPPPPPGHIYALEFDTPQAGRHRLGSFITSLDAVSDLGRTLGAEGEGTARIFLTLQPLAGTGGEAAQEVYAGRLLLH